ncbi:nickel pincer cofactor biosynthesis protein LarB [Haladaptatus pallidirubidus]|uniref:Nickel pincer cofactor biosynthesis protein LarB n=1 Tax=Haladaptatus pallidirubidus TaxID=1008152 RepID=A0AAV3UG50_9EURY|nr:nickel pincer cofactor biosynthesis protein LarB [Haladaptatus pallidirubidus]
MRELLEAVAAGELSVTEAESRLSGYATTEAGRFDAARETRRGVPEAILCDGKMPTEVATLATAAVETAGRALVTRANDEQIRAVRARLAEEHPDANVRVRERANILVAHAVGFDKPELDATVGVVSAGTSDAIPAGEAVAVAEEMGATTEEIHDVGVASLVRVLDEVDALRDLDVLVVAAGREGALPTVIAGLVDTPVIGLPVSNGYGHAGQGKSALSGMLQSCTVLSTVNIDAGFVAGAQAGLIARAIDSAKE